MSFAFTTIGMNPPPPRRAAAAVAPIANPATVPASLSSSRMAARDRAQSWRGKYLRALNICSEDIEHARRLAAQKASAATTTVNGKSRLRALSFHRTDSLDPHALSRSYNSSTEKEEEHRKSRARSTQHQQHAHRRAAPQQHQIHAVPLRAPSTNIGASSSSMATRMGMPMAPTAANPYGFPMRANIARGRRCHTDPFTLEERVSAPIQIPSAVSSNNQLDGLGRNFDSRVSGGDPRGRASQSIRIDADVVATNSNNHTTTTLVRLLSWEEPVAMLKAADAVSKGWHMPMASMELGLRRGRDVGVDDLPADRLDDEDEDDLDSHGGDIFEMDESDDDATQNNQSSRRRFRTESMNIVTSGREKRTHHTFYDEAYGQDGAFGGHVRGADLSQSFVPPHQLVDRSDCFSIGLRDEFKKRRPTNHI